MSEHTGQIHPECLACDVAPDVHDQIHHTIMGNRPMTALEFSGMDIMTQHGIDSSTLGVFIVHDGEALARVSKVMEDIYRERGLEMTKN